jgi:methanogenic corrinoid protein MtbC1
MTRCVYEGKTKEVEQTIKHILAEGKRVREVLSEGLLTRMSVVVNLMNYQDLAAVFRSNAELRFPRRKQRRKNCTEAASSPEEGAPELAIVTAYIRNDGRDSGSTEGRPGSIPPQ